ncbi:hypothetical protein A167_02974 [Alcanivorax sp. S71-1-4]|uniref:DUF368 domain-containing protein n=1 Tax=Alcanivorax sp. S71-1-4 TaxID=1177159 RepID=UPI00135B8B22|nr:DUF368 domain-containing protein [Alcanivorax sp. S71-1-4]KAF0807264.1 hypothetical protein A167_02974 [Alcanivorax sp. S71-1-4]
MKRLSGIYLRGMAMGAADVVPGVSGGTIALITGIYETLIRTLSGLTPSLLGIWRRQGFMAFWRAANLGFLSALLAGIVTSIALLARLITWLMDAYPVPLWSFFCGLIIASILLLLKPLPLRRASTWLMLAAGGLIAVWVMSRPPLGDALSLTLPVFFIAGAVAICAMILPGISGSFILVILGMYAPVLAAVKGAEWAILLTFVAGCATGLLSFVHLLRWLLARFHEPVMAMLVGFMAGSLAVLWPWRVPDSGGETLFRNVWPAHYVAETGLPAMLPAALIALIAGVVLVWLLSHFAGHNEANSAAGTSAS